MPSFQDQLKIDMAAVVGGEFSNKARFVDVINSVDVEVSLIEGETEMMGALVKSVSFVSVPEFSKNGAMEIDGKTYSIVSFEIDTMGNTITAILGDE